MYGWNKTDINSNSTGCWYAYLCLLSQVYSKVDDGLGLPAPAFLTGEVTSFHHLGENLGLAECWERNTILLNDTSQDIHYI